MKKGWAQHPQLSVFIYFLLGFALRATFLAYNSSLGLEPGWTQTTKAWLVAAELLAGKNLSIEFSTQEAMDLFRVSDRGVALLHFLLIKVFGQSSFFLMSAAGAFLDSLMVFVAWGIGRRMGGLKNAKYSALAYATFIPAIFISINPFWYVWLAAGALAATWLIMEMVQMGISKQTSVRFSVCALALGLISLATAQFRSTFVFFLFFMPFWLLILHFLARGEKLKTRNVAQTIVALLVLGAMTIGSNTLINRALNGGTMPTRSDFGFVLWLGFGEFANPMNVTANDPSVGSYYEAKTGRRDTTDFKGTGWRDANAWLLGEGIKFIKENPILYASMVIRRCLKFVFPNFRISRISDLESYNVYEEKVLGTRAARMAIVKSDQLLTLPGLRKLWKIDKFYFFEGGVRVILIFLLPLLLALGLIYLRLSAFGLIGISYLLYSMATLGLIRGPDMNLFSAWTAIVPVVSCGMIFLLDHLKKRFM